MRKGQANRFKVFNYLGGAISNLMKQQPTSDKEDTSKGIINWEAQGSRRNDFPQQLVNNIQNSPVASSCIDTWHDFLVGDGFVNQEVNNLTINPQGDTLYMLMDKLAQDLANFEGFCFHVSYNLNGEITELHYQPFEQTRLGMIEAGEVTNIKTNPYFGIPREYEDKYTKTYYPFNPDPEHVKEEIQEHNRLVAKGEKKGKYCGQIFWFSIERALSRIYPKPFFYSANKWFEVDAQIQEFHERNISNNFLLSVVMNVWGNPDAPARDEDAEKDNYETVGEVFNQQMAEALGGSKSGGIALVNWMQNAEDKIDITAFPSNTHHELFLKLQQLVTDQIATATKVPPVLASIQTAGKLGDTTDIINSVKVMQARVQKKQSILTDELFRVMRIFRPFVSAGYTRDDMYLTKYAMVDLLPEKALEDLTLEERRKHWKENFNLDIDLVEIEAEPTPEPPIEE